MSIASASGFNNSGTAVIGGGYSTGVTFTVNGAASNSGTVSIASGAEINVTGANAYTQSGGTTTVNGILINSGGVALNGGTLRGVGYLGADVSNVAGTLQASPDGLKPGALSIAGSYNQGAGGTLSEIIGGTGGGQFGMLTTGVAVGKLTLGGTLDIAAINNFQFHVGQSFDIINFPANSLSGAFSTLQYECPGPSCVTAQTTGGSPLVINEGGTQIGIVADYLDSLGEVALTLETPPPTAVSWQGTSGAWSNAAAWSDSIVPLGYQDITIGTGAGGTVTYDQTSAAIDSLTIGAGTSSDYALSFSPSDALAVAKTVTINSGGAIDVAAAGASLNTGGALTNEGTLNVANGGTLAVVSPSTPADLTNSAAGTMNVDAGTATGGSSAAVSGTISNIGTLTIGNGGLTSATNVSAGGLANSGILIMTGASANNGASLVVSGNVTNVLMASIGSFANLTVTGSGNSYTQTCGALCFAATNVDGTLTAPAVNINGGVLQGHGTINGNVINAGLVAGGSYYPVGSPSPGVLNISGGYTQTSTGTLAEAIAGTGTPGANVSALNVSGSVTLDGTLEVNTLNSFAFAPGQTFDIVNFAPNGLSGTFATLTYGTSSGPGNGLISIGNNLDLAVNYNNGGGELALQVGSLDTWQGATDNWTGANDPTNWSTGAKPTATEDVLVGGGNGGTVTYNEASDTVQSLTVQPGKTSAYHLALGINDALAITNTVNINAGGEIDVTANGAALNVGGALSNAGTLTLGQNTTSGLGGTAGQGGSVSVGTSATPANLTNTGAINIDPASTAVLGVTPATGGSTLAISGELDNSGGTLNIGNTGISAPSTVSAASFDTSSSSNILDGAVTITGQDPTKGTTAAALELGAGITGIATSGSLTLANSNAFLTTNTASPFTNNALSGLTSNAGAITLEDGASVAIGTNVIATLTNSGTISVDNGAKLAIGSVVTTNLANSGKIFVGNNIGNGTLSVNGTLDNGGGTIQIGYPGDTSSDSMSAQGFAFNSGPSGGTVTNTLNGSVAIVGDFSPGSATAALLLTYGIDAIAPGSSLYLDDANSFVNLNNNVANNSGLSGLTNVAGQLELESGASVATGGAFTIAGTGTVGVDDTLSSGGSKLAVGGLVSNGGTFNIGLNLGATSPSTVSAAGFANTGTTNLGGLAGGTASFTVNGTASNSGTVDIGSTGVLNVTGVSYSQNGGSTTVASGGNLSLSAGSYTQSGGTATVGGTLTAPGGATINGGTLQGTGTIAANVMNVAGTLQASPEGVNPGTLTINGSYTHQSGATLNELIGGTNSGQFSVLNVTGVLTLGGTLDISTLDGFTFANKQTFDIIDFPANALSGTFATLAYNGVTGGGTSPLDIGNNMTLDVQYENSQGLVVLDVSQISTNDIWGGTTDDWTGSNDQTNWSQGSAPTSQQDTIVGGGTGGTVTLNENTGIKSLTVEASDATNSATNYTLAIGAGNTLTVGNKTTINQGGQVDLLASGAALTSAGNMSNGGVLHLESGGSVTVGTSGAPANFSNSITVSGNPVGGAINVDTTGSGGSNLTITGTLNNTNGTLNVGNSGITSNAMATAQDFVTSGTLDGTVKITGPSSGAQAALALGTSVTSIASTGSLTLSGTNAFVELSGAPGSSSALTSVASNAGALEVDNGAKVSTNGSSQAGLFTNTGTITTKGTTFDSSLDNITVAGSGGLSNSGTIDIAADGALRVTNGAFVQTSGGQTTVGGTSGNQAELHADAASVSNSLGMDIQTNSNLNVANYGNVDVGLSQAGKHRDLSNEGTIAISSSGSMTVTGNLTNNSGTFTNNGFLSVNGNMTNQGTVTLNANGTIDPVMYTQTGGSTVVNGTLIAGTIDLQGGTLSGNGTVSGTIDLAGGTLSGTLKTSGGVVNGSTLTPNNGGSPLMPGTMLISGSYTQTSSGTLGELIAGTAMSGNYGRLNVSGSPGTAALDGTLDVLTGSFTNGFTFGSSDTYYGLVTANGDISGAFATLEFDCPGPNCVSGSGAEVSGTDMSAPLLINGGRDKLGLLYDGDCGIVDLQVTAATPIPTPVPPSLPLFASGLLALSWMMRRKMRQVA